MPAGAAAYDDFARGVSANERADNDLAVSSFTAALQAGDLAPALVPAAYRGRGLAYLRSENCVSALSDLTAALTLAPSDIESTKLRARAAFCSGNLALADSDFGAVIAKDPKNAAAHMGRGRVRWRLQNFTVAQSDFESVMQVVPKYQYAVLWDEMVRLRIGTLDVKAAADAASQFYEDDWPQPVLALFGGKNTPQKVLALAAKGDDKDLQGRICEANFYVGEWLLGSSDQSAAKASLEAAAAHCPKNYIEYDESHAELDRLK